MSCKLNGGSRKRRSMKKSYKTRSKRGGVFGYDVRGKMAKAMGKDEGAYKMADMGMMKKADDLKEKSKEEYKKRFGSQDAESPEETVPAETQPQEAGKRKKTRKNKKSRKSRKSRKSKKSGGGFFDFLKKKDDKEENDNAVNDTADGMGPSQEGGRRRKSKKSKKSRKSRKSRR